MASISNQSSFGTLTSKPSSGLVPNADWSQAGGVHQQGPYNIPTDQIRYSSTAPTVNPYGQGSDINSRINSLAQSYYTQMQAHRDASNRFVANGFNQGLSSLQNLRTDPTTARNIFQGAYNLGLTGTNPNQNSGWHVGMTTQDNPNSIESQTAAANRGIVGAANQSSLLQYGINPNAVSTAYQNFLNNNTSGRY